METVKLQLNLPKSLSLKLDWWQLEKKKNGISISKADLVVEMLQIGSFGSPWDDTIVGEISELKALEIINVGKNTSSDEHGLSPETIERLNAIPPITLSGNLRLSPEEINEFRTLMRNLKSLPEYKDLFIS